MASTGLGTTLKLEAIGDDGEQLLREADRTFDALGFKTEGRSRSIRPLWVAEIVGRSKRYGLARRFLDGKKDYAEANSVGSRGVYVYYFLEAGPYYEVSSPVTWRHIDRYFAKVNRGEVVKVDRAEVDRWLEEMDELGLEVYP